VLPQGIAEKLHTGAEGGQNSGVGHLYKAHFLVAGNVVEVECWVNSTQCCSFPVAEGHLSQTASGHCREVRNSSGSDAAALQLRLCQELRRSCLGGEVVSVAEMRVVVGGTVPAADDRRHL
jgi:hypothetical protein